jgi:hypothetical protein
MLHPEEEELIIESEEEEAQEVGEPTRHNWRSFDAAITRLSRAPPERLNLEAVLEELILVHPSVSMPSGPAFLARLLERYAHKRGATRAALLLARAGCGSGDLWLPIVLHASQLIPGATLGEDVLLCEALQGYARAVHNSLPVRFAEGAVECMRRVVQIIRQVANAKPAIAVALYDAISLIRPASQQDWRLLIATLVADRDVKLIPKLLMRMFEDYLQDNNDVGYFIQVLEGGHLPWNVIYLHNFPLTAATSRYAAAACVAHGENEIHYFSFEATQLFALLVRLSCVISPNTSEWNILAGSQRLRSFWDKMIEQGYNPGERYQVAWDVDGERVITYPWPFTGNGNPYTLVFPIVHSIPPRVAWRPSVRCLEWSALCRFVESLEAVRKPLEDTPQLFVKLHTSFAGLLVRACCDCLHTIKPLGEFDDDVCRALSFDKGAFRVDTREQVEKLVVQPQVFRDIPSWHVESLSGAKISIYQPLAVIYETMLGGIVGNFPPSRILQFYVDVETRTLFCNAELVDWNSRPPSPFLSEQAHGCLLSGVARERVRAGLRATIFQCLSADGMEAIRGGGCVNTLIREYRASIDFDLRLFSGVVQGVTHVYAGLWCVGQFTQCEPLRPLEAEKLPTISVTHSPDDIMRTILHFRAESGFRRYRVSDRDDDFISVFTRGVLWELTSGVELSRRPVKLRISYLRHLGWICAYLLLRRVCFSDFGPEIDVDANFFARLSSAGLTLFKMGFNIISDFETLLTTINMGEFCDVLRKRPHPS